MLPIGTRGFLEGDKTKVRIAHDEVQITILGGSIMKLLTRHAGFIDDANRKGIDLKAGQLNRTTHPTLGRIQRTGACICCAPAVVLVLLFSYVPMYGILIAFRTTVPLSALWIVHGRV